MTIYPVNDIYQTIQGEGCQTGQTMILVRLHGCAVGCPFCDTKHTWYFNKQNERRTIEEVLGETSLFTYKSNSEIVAYCREKYPAIKWVLITGGEPADYDLKALVTACHDARYKVAIETSGTAVGHINSGADWICVSPKIDMPGGRDVLTAAVEVADEIKHVVGKAHHVAMLDDLLSRCTLKPTTQICLQPVSQSEKATLLCIETTLNRGWRLSAQVHKYLNLP